MVFGVLESLGVLIVRVIAALLATAIALPEMAFAEESPWEKTEINESTIIAYVNQAACYHSALNFIACAQAINSILIDGETPMTLTNAVLEKEEAIGEVVKSFGAMKFNKIVFLPYNLKKSAKESKQKDIEYKANLISSWTAIYTETKDSQLPLDNILMEALKISGVKNRKTKIASALNQFLNNAVDAHTEIVPKETFENLAKASNVAVYAGVGLLLLPTKDGISVEDVFEDNAAHKAGIKYKDLITHVDGEAYTTTKAIALQNKISGEPGSVVSLKILRGKEVLNFNVKRAQVEFKVISGKIITDSKSQNKIGYIQLLNFMKKGVCGEFIALAKSLKAQGAQSLVLDLRDNGGGSLYEGLCLARAYTNDHAFMLQSMHPVTGERIDGLEFYNTSVTFGSMKISESEEIYNLYDKKPLVILLNAASASASELLTGVLQVQNRAITVGVRTFGKGTVQSIMDPAKLGFRALAMPNVEIKITTSRFHFADGSSNQLVGIQPDFVAYTSPKPQDYEMYFTREEDMYLYPASAGLAAPPMASKKVKQRITKCVKARNLISNDYKLDLTSALGPDYQQVVAREVAACL